MSEVLRAVRLGDRAGRGVVVKRPWLGERASGRAAQAIAREAEVLSAVRAPEIVSLEAAGEIAGLPYVAVEYVRGVPLDALLVHAGALPPAVVRAVALDLARALASVSSAGWVHGDVAPSNVLVDDAGEARLIDFGLATRVGAKRVEIAGKPGYVAPEAIRATTASPAEDVYGWGVVVAECALGTKLFEEQDLAEAASRGDAPRRVAELAASGLDVAAALQRDASARPAAPALIAGLDPKAIDRGGLAQLVAAVTLGATVEAGRRPSEPLPPMAAMAGEPKLARHPSRSTPRDSPALTPTAPMVRAVAATLIDVARRGEAGEALQPASSDATRASPPRASKPWRHGRLAVLLLGVAIVAGVFGRLSARTRQSSLSFAGTFPRRAEVRLDGQVAKPPIDGSALPVAPGRHTLVLVLPKGEMREYTFQVHPGQHVVLLPLQRGGASVEIPEERDP